jgi:hypothetical protein
METEKDKETETDNTQTAIWNWRTFAKYLYNTMHSPYSEVWNASDISWHNFHQRYIGTFSAFYDDKNDMLIPINSYAIGTTLRTILAELETCTALKTVCCQC